MTDTSPANHENGSSPLTLPSPPDAGERAGYGYLFAYSLPSYLTEEKKEKGGDRMGKVAKPHLPNLPLQ
jgi:hypothetical protein